MMSTDEGERKWDEPSSEFGGHAMPSPVSSYVIEDPAPSPVQPRAPRPKIKNIICAIALAAAVMIAGMVYVVMNEDGRPTVTLSSGGQSVGQTAVTEGGFVSIDWLEDAESRLIAPEEGLNFAGWYTDTSYQTVFFRYTPITGNTTLYAGWNELSFTVTQSITKTAPNRLTCTFDDTTGTSESTTWTIKDSFKTSGPVPGAAQGSGVQHITTLNIGMYDVTMTASVNGESKKTVRSVVVGEDESILIENTVKWKWSPDASIPAVNYTFTYSFHVSEYIEFAKMNRDRDFKVPQIADHVVWDTPVVYQIANELKRLVGLMPEDLSKQDEMNFIMSFLNGYWQADSVYYKIPGVHKSDFLVEYYKYPAEALYDWAAYGYQGDCDCKAILTAAVARAYGFDDIAIMVLTNPVEREGHAAAGIKDESFVPIPADELNPKAFFFELNGYYASDTNGGLRLGELEKTYSSSGWTIRAYSVA